MRAPNAVTVQFIHAVIISVLTILLLLGLLLLWLVDNTAEQKLLVQADVPTHLLEQFPDTDWSVAQPEIGAVELGGPLRDMIQTLNEPVFIPINTIDADKKHEVAVLVTLDGVAKVYPLYILYWHGVVHDTIGDTSVAVTFSPTSDRVMVYEREVAGGEQVMFGVSGSLLDGDMVMFDRAEEALWWQRNGKILAGRNLETKLKPVSFLREDLESIKKRHSEALVLSDATGFGLDYRNSPYAQ